MHRYDDPSGIEVYKETEYLGFVITERKPKTVVVQVWNRREQLLGEIKWYGRWRQYTFTAMPDTVFNHQCLSDIIEVLNALNAEQKRKKPDASDTD